MQTQSSRHAEARPHSGKKWLLFVVLVGIVLGLDQATKRVVHNTFKLYESRPVVASFLHLTYVRNSGAAFGLLSRQNPGFLRLFFLGVTFVALVILLFYYARVPWEQTLTLWGLCLIASGALGNGIDRLWLGQVIDFIDVHVSHYHWPAFNVADSAICVGVGCLLLDTVRRT
jgi:signal peptidase II